MFQICKSINDERGQNCHLPFSRSADPHEGQAEGTFTKNNFLKGVWHEIFVFRFFFHETVSPGPLALSILFKMVPKQEPGGNWLVKKAWSRNSKISCQTPFTIRSFRRTLVLLSVAWLVVEVNERALKVEALCRTCWPSRSHRSNQGDQSSANTVNLAWSVYPVLYSVSLYTNSVGWPHCAVLIWTLPLVYLRYLYSM